MAPSTRSSEQRPTRVTRSTRQSSRQQTPDWNFVPRQDEQGNADDFEANDLDQNHAHDDVHSPDLDAALAPLRNMADHVGREVEKFAEKLDQFLTSLPDRNKFEAVLGLVEDFKKIAQDAVTSLQKNHERDVALQLRREWNAREQLPMQSSALIRTSTTDSAPVLTEKKAQQIKELRKWQQEADIWELFRIMLELHHNPDANEVKQCKEEAARQLGSINRYTSEADLFSHFILQDDLARERLMVKKWLEETVDHQETDLNGIVQELESKTTRGKGMWQGGWMHTREKIKGEKRTRSWSNAPDIPLPHVRRTDNTQLLVTTLDPDAMARQGRALEKEDEYFDRAMWIACWEMLRRGKSWEDVSAWCQKQREGWRAMSLGMAIDPTDNLSRAAWRQMCYLASQADGFGDYEAAVYGLLGGGHSAVEKICRNVDDKLFNYYSSALIRQFDDWLATNHPARAPQTRRGRGENAAKDPQEQIFELIERLRKQPETSTESIQPMKIIQSYLLANDVGSMIHTMGFAVAIADSFSHLAGQLIYPLKPFWSGNANQPEEEVVLDHQTLRVAAHMSIILAELRGEGLQGDEKHADENVTVAYVQALRAIQNRYIIPLYCSRLTWGRRMVTMAHALEDIKSPSEQKDMLGLMKRYNMDIIATLEEQLFYMLNKHMGRRLQGVPPLRLLEKTDDPLYPGQRVILNYLPDKWSQQDESIVAALRWFELLDGEWKATFHCLNYALRKCLMAGRIACALKIVYAFPYHTVCRRKTLPILGVAVNLMEKLDFPPEHEDPKWTELREQSRGYFDAYQIMEAIKALVHYRKHEAEYTGMAMKLSAAPMDLKNAKETVDELMEPILSGNHLEAKEDDEDEMRDFGILRQCFIPELILAYNTVLYSAGAAISRDNLIQSMDLSVTVAETESLYSCFTTAGRMQELVKSFAETSKKMLILKAEGKPWRPRKDREGKELGLWEIGPQHGYGGNHEIPP